MQSNNILIAAAGSGKTTAIVKDVLNDPARRVALVTYTINNTRGIGEKFHQLGGPPPERASITPWFTFVLRQLVRPYQNSVVDGRIGRVAFISGRSSKFVKKSNVSRYYFHSDGVVYSDKLTELAILCDDKSEGRVMARLNELYERIYIDEVQDLAGYDLELVERMMRAGIAVTLVGDMRQSTFRTNYSPKNKKYAGLGIVEKFEQWANAGLCDISHLTETYRCHQTICDLADSLYPGMLPTKSLNTDLTGHDGVYVVRPEHVTHYVARFQPRVLRYDRRTKCGDLPALNFGSSKGLQFPRVLIFPHGPLKKLLKTGDTEHVAKSVAKVYVAITRARHSVAFVCEGGFKVAATEFEPD